MRTGKAIAQGAHASMGALLSVCESTDSSITIPLDERIKNWLDGTFTKICVYVESEQELLDLHQRAQEAGIISCLIQDSGKTEFHGIPTHTCVAIGPDWSEKIDFITSGLPLL